jgi:hypothetical protein
MDRNHLRELARQERIRDDAYSFEGGLPLEQLVLAIEDGGWCVYYSERGLRSGLRHFETEDEACTYMLDLLLRDPTNREGDRPRTSPDADTRP